jgi:NAD(P)H-hydrate epimerase
MAAVHRAVDRYGCVVVLKGAGTLISAPDAGVLVDGGDPSLATAGTGDVLTGVIAAFLSKGMDARLAAAAGATAHHWAAIEVSLGAGLIASDLLEALPKVLSGH